MWFENERDQHLYSSILNELDGDVQYRKWMGDSHAGTHVQPPVTSLYYNNARTVVGYEAELGIDLFAYLLMHARRGFRVLDVGCGLGRCAEELAVFSHAKNLGVVVEALDLKQPPLLNRVAGRQGDVYNLSELEQYDLILSCFVLPWLKNPLTALKQMYNALKPDGMAAATVFFGAVFWDDVDVFLERSRFADAVKKAGGRADVHFLERSPEGASAVYLNRGHRRLALPEVTCTIPDQGCAVPVYYWSKPTPAEMLK